MMKLPRALAPTLAPTLAPVFAPVLAVALMALPMTSLPAAAAELAARQITVTGEGVVHAVPDMATIRLGVAHRGKTPAAVMDQVSQDTAKVIARLERLGIAARDMQTSNLTLFPVMEHDNKNGRRVAGYEASNLLQVRVRDLDQLGALLGAVLEDGANRFDGLEFGLSDPAAARDQARQKAVAEALRKAGLYAQAAGVDLGAVQSISERGQQVMPMARMTSGMEAMADVPVAEGELALSQSVTVVVALD